MIAHHEVEMCPSGKYMKVEVEVEVYKCTLVALISHGIKQNYFYMY